MGGQDRQNRIYSLDILRTLAMLGVIAQHILGIYGKLEIPVWTMKAIAIAFEAVRFAVPAFIVLAGLMASRVNPEKFSYSRYLAKRIKTIFIPYVIWSLIYVDEFETWHGIKSFCVTLFKGGACYHLWYVPVIIEFAAFSFLIVPVFDRLCRCSKPALSLGITGTAAFVLMTVSARIHGAAGLGAFIARHNYHMFPAWCFYYFCGLVWGRYFNGFRAFIRRYCPVFFAVLAAGEAYIIRRDMLWIASRKAVNFNVVGLLQPLCAVIIICFIAVLFRLAMAMESLKTAEIFRFISVHSYRTYLIHALAINRINKKIIGYFPRYSVYYPLLFVLVTITSLAIAFVLDILADRIWSLSGRLFSGEKSESN